MQAYRSAIRHPRVIDGLSRTSQRTPRQCSRSISGGPRQRGQPRGDETASGPGGKGKLLSLAAVFGLSAAGFYYYPILSSMFSGEMAKQAQNVKIPQAEIEYEKERPHATSKENNRDLISSQHLQVRASWENPGVYAWGSNAGKVIDPASKEANIKVPRRISYFNGQILRDIRLTQDFGVAVTEKGNLVQWGLGFCQEDPTPRETLKGRDISKITVSDDRVLALSSSGQVYAVPAARQDLNTDNDASASGSWLPFWGSGNDALPSSSIRELTPSNMGWGEKIVDVASGLHHALLLTSKGRVFSSVSSTSEYPSLGQMGIPGLEWATRPKGPFDQPQEIQNLKGYNIAKVAAGDYHSVVLDKEGKLFTFGDNTYGQLGIPTEGGFKTVDVPAMVPVPRLYTNTGLMPKVTSIAAGGLNTFFTVDANRPTYQVEDGDASLAPARRMPRVTADTWACGNGVYGSLGTGKWTHVALPTKIPALSALFEFDEQTNKMVPIRLSNISVGATHSAATMKNETRVGVSTRRGSENDTNWGADVLFWGGNSNYQLGTGKKSNLNAPAYIGALDAGPVEGFHRLQLTPRQTVRLGEDGKGRKATLEQKVECGRKVTCVYSAV